MTHDSVNAEAFRQWLLAGEPPERWAEMEAHEKYYYRLKAYHILRGQCPIDPTWKPIRELDTSCLCHTDNILLWCPNLVVYGPPVVCAWTGKEWVVAITGFPLKESNGVPTHYQLLDEPDV